MTNQPKDNEWIEKLIDKIWYLKRYSDTRYFDWEEVKKELKKLIIDNLPQSISREAVEKMINRYKRLEEWEKDNIWWCALRCFIKDLNSLLPNPQDDTN